VQAVHFEAAFLESEVAQHVVERSVLEHQDDDVLDLVERRDRVVDVDPDKANRDFGPAAEEGPEQAHDAG
jgi:hypothetical protein